MSESLLKLCAHRALDGIACRGAAMRNSNYCRHHRRFYPELPAYIFEVTDAQSVWAATMRLVYDHIEGRANMDSKTIYLCAQQLHNFARTNLTKPPRRRRGVR
jgi:hypothetical protein